MSVDDFAASADGADGLKAEIERLAALPDLEYVQQRRAAAKEFNIPVGMLDKLRARHPLRKSRSSGRANGFDQQNQQDSFDLSLDQAEVEQVERLSALDSVLDEVARTVKRLGAAGVRREAKILYLAITSRLLPKPPDVPAHVLVKGTSAGGKNYLVDVVCRMFPDHAVQKMTGMSDRTLAYLSADMAHRFIVLAEATSIEDSPIALGLIRSLLSEGEICYWTVEKDEDGHMVSVMKHLAGPTGLIMTTTAPKIHEENETRHLTINISDEWSQTARILAEQALLARGKDVVKVDLTLWHNFQTWLVKQERRVVVPYASSVAELIESAPVRVRRDFPRFLTLVKAHALLHQVNRKRDDQDRIVATLADYETVHDLAARAFAESAEVAHEKSVVQVLDAIEELAHEHSSGVNIHHLIAYAKKNKWGSINRDVLSRRCRTAIERGLLVNRETKSGQLARYELTAAAREPQTLFPTVEAVRAHRRSTARPSRGRGNGSSLSQ